MSDELREMLSYCRPAGSSMERQFLERFIDEPLDPDIDRIGNRIVDVGTKPKVLWSCHTDTVHREGLRQKVRLTDGDFYYAASKHSNCLGADDTAGVWLAKALNEYGIPGRYVFHWGEEIGCKGAKVIYDESPELLEGIDICIALDREATASVITHQAMGRCCSTKFAEALCRELAMNHQLDDTGVWTDNVEYLDTIPEITNLSVGYYNQHTPKEMLDRRYLHELLEALIQVDYEGLPIERDPTVQDYAYGEYSSSRSLGPSFNYSDNGRTQSIPDAEDIAALITDYPEAIAHLLIEYGFDEDDLLEAVYHQTGIVDQRVWKDIVTEEDEWEHQEQR